MKQNQRRAKTKSAKIPTKTTTPLGTKKQLTNSKNKKHTSP
jgi:hypothetical protein